MLGAMTYSLQSWLAEVTNQPIYQVATRYILHDTDGSICSDEFTTSKAHCIHSPSASSCQRSQEGSAAHWQNLLISNCTELERLRVEHDIDFVISNCHAGRLIPMLEAIQIRLVLLWSPVLPLQVENCNASPNYLQCALKFLRRHVYSAFPFAGSRPF